jgi:hypothetical protein
MCDCPLHSIFGFSSVVSPPPSHGKGILDSFRTRIEELGIPKKESAPGLLFIYGYSQGPCLNLTVWGATV